VSLFEKSEQPQGETNRALPALLRHGDTKATGERATESSFPAAPDYSQRSSVGKFKSDSHRMRQLPKNKKEIGEDDSDYLSW